LIFDSLEQNLDLYSMTGFTLSKPDPSEVTPKLSCRRKVFPSNFIEGPLDPLRTRLDSSAIGFEHNLDFFE